MVRLRMAPRSWMTMLEQHNLTLEFQAENASRRRPVPSLCTHPSFRRYGNKAGRFSQCNDCLLKYKYNQERQGWEVYGEQPSQRSSQLPLPSPSTILPSTNPRAMGSRPKARAARTASRSSMAPSETMTPWEEAGMTFEEYDAAMTSAPHLDSDEPDGYPPYDEGYDWTSIA